MTVFGLWAIDECPDCGKSKTLLEVHATRDGAKASETLQPWHRFLEAPRRVRIEWQLHTDEDEPPYSSEAEVAEIVGPGLMRRRYAIMPIKVLA